MAEVSFALIGAWLYLALVWLIGPLAGPVVSGFLLGYFGVATVDLWRCWRSVDRRAGTPLELAIAVLFLFPIGSLFWLPWDAARALGAKV